MTTETLVRGQTRTITYGIIGCGMMGQEHLRNIALLDNAAVGAIFEPDALMRVRAAQFAPDARFVDNLDALLDIPEIDCLLIASPNFRHVEQLQAIARRRPLPVLQIVVEERVVADGEAPAHEALGPGLRAHVGVLKEADEDARAKARDGEQDLYDRDFYPLEEVGT